MAKIQFQKSYSLFEFLKNYGTKEQCEKVLCTYKLACSQCALTIRITRTHWSLGLKTAARLAACVLCVM